jgi:hypothetical protein
MRRRWLEGGERVARGWREGRTSASHVQIMGRGQYYGILYVYIHVTLLHTHYNGATFQYCEHVLVVSLVPDTEHEIIGRVGPQGFLIIQEV